MNMRAILSVTKQEEYRILYHSRTGLTSDRSKATRFKTLDHAVRAARKRYSPRLAPLHTPEGTYLSRDLQSWTAQTIKESQP